MRSTQHVLFHAGGVALAADASAVQQIHDQLEVQPVAGTKRWFLGLAVANGQLLPVSDLGALLNNQSSSGHTLQVHQDLGIAGLRVDGVAGLSEAVPKKQDQWQPVSMAQDNIQLTAFVIVENDVVHRVLDVAQLVQSERFTDIAADLS